mmetsp:Transcript_14909/g.35467  ORF Transcript_14909/g.35467 Transcript_14909/m.35467 type:complete len:349 (-) Transcript_14909:382-1428(-)
MCGGGEGDLLLRCLSPLRMDGRLCEGDLGLPGEPVCSASRSFAFALPRGPAAGASPAITFPSASIKPFEHRRTVCGEGSSLTAANSSGRRLARRALRRDEASLEEVRSLTLMPPAPAAASTTLYPSCDALTKSDSSALSSVVNARIRSSSSVSNDDSDKPEKLLLNGSLSPPLNENDPLSVDGSRSRGDAPPLLLLLLRLMLSCRRVLRSELDSEESDIAACSCPPSSAYCAETLCAPGEVGSEEGFALRKMPPTHPTTSRNGLPSREPALRLLPRNEVSAGADGDLARGEAGRLLDTLFPLAPFFSFAAPTPFPLSPPFPPSLDPGESSAEDPPPRSGSTCCGRADE